MITGILFGFVILFSILVAFEAILILGASISRAKYGVKMIYIPIISILIPLNILSCCWEFPNSLIARFFGLTN